MMVAARRGATDSGGGGGGGSGDGNGGVTVAGALTADNNIAATGAGGGVARGLKGVAASLLLHAAVAGGIWLAWRGMPAPKPPDRLMVELLGMVADRQTEQAQAGQQAPPQQEPPRPVKVASPPPEPRPAEPPPPIQAEAQQPPPVQDEPQPPQPVQNEPPQPVKAEAPPPKTPPPEPLPATSQPTLADARQTETNSPVKVQTQPRQKPPQPVKAKPPRPRTEPPRPLPAAPPAPGTAQTQQVNQTIRHDETDIDAQRRYLVALRKAIKAKLVYPPDGGGVTGAPVIAFNLNADGTIEPGSLTVRRSSGYSVLDNQALNAVREAAPFPSPPKPMSLAMEMPFTEVRQ